MKKSYVFFAKGQIPDGYFGDWATVDFYYDPSSGKTMVDGRFSYGTPPADSIQEAMYTESSSRVKCTFCYRLTTNELALACVLNTNIKWRKCHEY